MAYDTSKLTRLEHLKTLAQRVKEKYATKTELTALQEEVNTLELAGGEPNVLEGVKVNGAALTIANKMVDVLIAESTNNGKIKVNNVDVTIHGLAALAYKANVSESDLASALATKLNAKADSSTVTTLSGQLSTLIGSDTSKSVRTIANEELAAQLIPQDAQDALDTLAEIAAWIQSHPDDAAAMNAAIEALEDLTAGNWGSASTIKGYIDNAISGLSISSYATKVANAVSGNLAALDANGNLTDSGKKPSDFVLAVSGKGLSTNDYTTAEKNKLSGIATGATKVEASNTNGNIKINSTETTVYTLPNTVVHGAIATDTEVNEMIAEVLGTAESSS